MVVKIFNAFKETMGQQTKGKSYLVKPGEEGYVIEEVEEGKPTIIAAPGQGNTKPSPSFLVDGSDGSVQELAPGKPIVIMKQAPPPLSPQSGKTYLVRQTPEGMVTEEYEGGKPIIINAAPTNPGSNLPPMMPFPVIGSDGQPVYDSEGKPVYANLEPMMKYMGFQAEQRRADERHGALMGLVKTVRENLGDGIGALKLAAEQAKAGTGAKPPETKQEQPLGSWDLLRGKSKLKAADLGVTLKGIGPGIDGFLNKLILRGDFSGSRAQIPLVAIDNHRVS
ncbi:unnamed protein product, partial [marine sediment metagenome]